MHKLIFEICPQKAIIARVLPTNIIQVMMYITEKRLQRISPLVIDQHLWSITDTASEAESGIISFGRILCPPRLTG